MSDRENPQVTFSKAIADETRQQIMGFVCGVWLSVNDVVERLDGRINQPTVSHHLRKLQEAQLVQVRQEGKHRYYTLNQPTVLRYCGRLLRAYAPDLLEGVNLPPDDGEE
jgi:DNA-binding transcriptional ArsR family regulator